MKERSRLAVFDVDGTLIDSQHVIVAAMLAACQANGVAAPKPEAVRRIIGLSLLDAVGQLLPHYGAELHVSVAQAYKQAFLEARGGGGEGEPLFPGAVAALEALEQAGWQLAIATGKSQRGLDSMIQRHGLQGRFVSLQTADHHPSKPHPAMLSKAIADAGVMPADAVMIGDTSFDMAMGRNAKSRCVGVAWGYHAPEELLDAGAEKVVENFSLLPGAMMSLFERA
ncbi:MAG TPA: HAD-IA family hydrolase [Rhodospirillaceae bacterium]|nr:HAD-IA family hydrolase [Rhodospirillaceae bacterium]